MFTVASLRNMLHYTVQPVKLCLGISNCYIFTYTILPALIQPRYKVTSCSQSYRSLTQSLTKELSSAGTLRHNTNLFPQQIAALYFVIYACLYLSHCKDLMHLFIFICPLPHADGNSCHLKAHKFNILGCEFFLVISQIVSL